MTHASWRLNFDFLLFTYVLCTGGECVAKVQVVWRHMAAGHLLWMCDGKILLAWLIRLAFKPMLLAQSWGKKRANV